MKQKIFNFGRFYSTLRHMRFGDDDLREEFKNRIVSQYTDGRTESLREMKRTEYETMCKALETANCRARTYITANAELKRWRSNVLHQMQKMGIDTANWARVDTFCIDKRIAGKRFSRLDTDELQELSVKLRMIENK